MNQSKLDKLRSRIDGIRPVKVLFVCLGNE